MVISKVGAKVNFFLASNFFLARLPSSNSNSKIIVPTEIMVCQKNATIFGLSIFYASYFSFLPSIITRMVVLFRLSFSFQSTVPLSKFRHYKWINFQYYMNYTCKYSGINGKISAVLLFFGFNLNLERFKK